MNKLKRLNVISEEIRLVSSSRNMDFELTVPFGNSTLKRTIRDITISSSQMSGYNYQALVASARCKDFNINRNALASVTTGQAATTSSQETIAPNKQFSPNVNTLNVSFESINQPWVSSDLIISAAFRINATPVAFPFDIYVNVFYVEE